jgi:RND family efflux transporter MFP subunit
MKYTNGVITGVVGTVLVGGAGWWLVTKSGDVASKPAHPAPATVPKPFKEDQATAIVLTPEAEARLAIKTATVERKPMKRVRTYGGEVTIPPGHVVVVSAPLAGTLKPVPNVAPAAGLAVKKGEAVFQLLPVLDPVGRANLTASRLEADGLVLNATEQLKLANTTLDRAKNVLAGGAGRQRDVDEAQAQVDIATKTLAAAKARRDLLAKVVGDAEAGAAAAIPVESPEAGVIRTVSALPGQAVPAGAPLFEVMDVGRVWVRVPVYVGDAAEVDAAAPAAVGGLAARPGDPTRPAKPVAAPPAANPVPGTVDLIYEMDNRETGYRPGERVGVALSLTGPAESLTVPWSAVVYDIFGGAWVYERTGDRAYTRRRVVVRSVTDGTAVLDSGPPPGTTVVTAGAAELFGTDAGFSK